MEQITTRGQTFLDESGRSRMFRGVNVVDKHESTPVRTCFLQSKDESKPSGLPESFYSDCVKAGFNLIRLGFNWSNIEPEPGQYNESYIDSLQLIMDRCAAHGIYVFLDLHQDLYGDLPKRGGDGAPLWAAKMDGLTPKKCRFVWAEGYFWDKAVHRAFDNFWENAKVQGKGLQEYYAAMLQHLARRFAGHPALFGFDYLNEPFMGKDGGKIFRKLIANLVKVTITDRRVKTGRLLADLLNKEKRDRILDHFGDEVFHKIVCTAYPLVKKFDEQRYSPFLDKMTAAVREVTDKGVIFADNCYYSNLGIPCSIAAVSVNGRREPNQCFQPHGYDLTVDTPAYEFANNERVGGIFREHRNTQERLNVPVVVGEWGGGGSGDRWLPHVEYLLNLFDSFQWSNTYYAYGDNFFEKPLMRVLVRPYPVAVSGEIEDYSYDSAAKRFTLRFRQERDYAQPTVLYVPRQPKAVEADGATQEQPIAGGEALLLSLATKPGFHTVVVQL